MLVDCFVLIVFLSCFLLIESGLFVEGCLWACLGCLVLYFDWFLVFVELVVIVDFLLCLHWLRFYCLLLFLDSCFTWVYCDLVFCLFD